MPKITKKSQRVFCADVPANNVVSQFGSLKAGSPNYSSDPAVIQNLPAWGSGWSGAVVANSAPALQDLNSLFYVITRQLGYLVQTGVAEWDASTVYYIGSLAQSGNGILMVSIADDHSAPLTDVTKWQPLLKMSSAALTEVMVSPVGYASGTNASPAAAIMPQGGVTTQRLIAGVGFSSGTVASPAAAIFPNGVSKVDVQGSNSTAVTVSTNVACNANLTNVFDYTYRVSATRTIPIHNLASGQTVTVLVSGNAGDAVTFNCFSDAGVTTITSKVSAYNGMSLTTAKSVFNITRVTGSVNWAIIAPLHGLS